MKTKELTQTIKIAVTHFSFFIFIFSFLFVSCNKTPNSLPQDNKTTFTIAIDAPGTRAASTVTPVRYIMEVWSEDGLTAENVFEDGTKNHAEILASAGNSFTITLDKTKAYTCLFWADFDTDNTAGVFNAASLKAISLNTGKSATEAYHANIAVAKGKNPALSVTLKHAVAKITLTENATVKVTDDIILKLSNIYPTFNVLDAQATGTAGEWTKTVKPVATTGIIGTFYFFAKTDKVLSDLKFTYATETEKTVSNIPLQQNYATNIKGEYSNVGSFTFDITADNDWLTPDNDREFGKAYKVGDIYPNTTSPMGVVFWIDETDPSYDAAAKTSVKGKIVSLDDAASTKWSTESINTGATSETDGADNTSKVLALVSYSASVYPAFAWCAAKNTPTPPAGIKWYVPAKEELKALYGKYTGDSNLDASVKTVVNASLSTVSGTMLPEASYWSSTQSSDNSSLDVNFNGGGIGTYSKDSNYRVRAISAF